LCENQSVYNNRLQREEEWGVLHNLPQVLFLPTASHAMPWYQQNIPLKD
jgi:hypothetical protein